MLSNHRNIPKRVILVFLIFTLLVSCSPISAIDVGTTSLRIHDIQGCGHISDYDGDRIFEIPGIVTSKTTKGFYLQDDQPDDLDCSSEAIYVFENSYPEVLPGDKVLVSGFIDEFFPGEADDHNLSITEIVNSEVKIISHNNPIPEAKIIGDEGEQAPRRLIDNDSLAAFEVDEDGIDFYESLESMLVQIDSGVVVGPRNEYNEVVIITENAIQENVISKEGALIQMENDANPERIILNMNDSNVDVINVGARLSHSVQGILDFTYGNFKVNTFGRVDFENSNPQTESFECDEDLLSVASYNVENLSRFDQNSKLRNIAQTIVNLMDAPDIVVLHEIMDDSGIEDDGTVVAELTINRIIEAIYNAGGPEYSYVQYDPQDGEDGGITGGNIRSVILFQSENGISLAKRDLPVLLQGNPNTIGQSNSAFLGTRKPLVVLFNKGEHQVLLIAAHLTSRGADSPLFGNQQPIIRPEELQRISQAEVINNFIESYTYNDPNTRIVIAGDMNDDPWSETITMLTSGTMTDLGTRLPQEERYSYIFDGNAIQVDYILTQKISGPNDRFMIFHINSLSDFTLKNSDHDPVLALIDLD